MNRASKKGRLVLAVMSLAALGALMLAPNTGLANVYVGGGTVVYRDNGNAKADKGVTACITPSSTGIGGGCLPFPTTAPSFVKVNDLGAAANVAFQVCVDNNGDGICRSGGGIPGQNDPCADFVRFSHDDSGAFFNPLGPLPPSRTAGCNPLGTGWNGYVVFICEGVHAVKDSTGGSATHSHPSSLGMISTTNAGIGSEGGNFCGGSREQVVEKSYTVLP